MPELGLDEAEAREVASVVAHLLDGGVDDVLDRLDEAGWWDLWAEAPAAYAQVFFATLGGRGAVTPALAGFVLRLLGTPDVSGDTGVVLGTGPDGSTGELSAGSQATVHGVVFAGPRATQLLCPVRSASGGELVRVRRAALTSAHTGDEPPGRVPLVSGTVVADHVAECDPRWEAAWRFVRTAVATQLVAMADAHLDAARLHCIEREQFGRPIASFQAVKHHLARVKVAIEAARPVVGAAWDGDDEGTVLSAKALAGQAYLEAHNRGMHVMGGMGYSREHPIGRFHRTGLALEAFGGTTRQCREAFARLVIAAPEALRRPEVPDVRQEVRHDLIA